ncbi:hypothetical protein NHQ30_010065 [Ciborinia camelliae]|nr:hypothetical protein NHQ30_010065 [Ciborinia camelliae]
MWPRIIPHSFKCDTPSLLAVRNFRPQIVSIFILRGIAREYSRTREQTYNGVSSSSVELPGVEDNFGRLNNLGSGQLTTKEKTTGTNTKMAMYRVVDDASPIMANEKRMGEISLGTQQAPNAHHKIFTGFLERVEDDGYVAYTEPSPYNARTRETPSKTAVVLESTPGTKSESSFMQTVPKIHANDKGQAQDFADGLHHKDYPTALGQQAVENANGHGMQETTNNTSATTSQDMGMPPRIEQTINISLRLDDRVTQELDRIIAKFSLYSPNMNKGRENISIIKGLPAQNWRQYQVFMRFLQFWRSPFYMGRVKPSITLLGRRWEVFWQIQDIPEIQAIRQTFRQVLEEDLPEYNFPSDDPWESRVVITRGISRTQAREILDSFNTAYPDGIDLGLITRCVLVHTIFSHHKIRTTVTQSPEFPLMGVRPHQSSQNTDERTQIEVLWNQTMSHIDTKFFKTKKLKKSRKTQESNNFLRDGTYQEDVRMSSGS